MLLFVVFWALAATRCVSLWTNATTSPEALQHRRKSCQQDSVPRPWDKPRSACVPFRRTRAQPKMCILVAVRPTPGSRH